MTGSTADAKSLDQPGVAQPAFGMPGTPLNAWQASQALAAVPHISLDQLIPPPARVVVVAPHPDDENLGCGGLLAGLAARGSCITVVAVTDGEGSHPDSSRWPERLLRSTRRQESQTAMARLGFTDSQVEWHHLALSDGQVAAHADALQAQLMSLLQPGDRLLTTWRGDGHCDHEATGGIAARCAAAANARLIEVPVWAWHWASPEDPRIPWRRAFKLPLAARQLARKAAAVESHVSQLHPDPSTGAAPVLAEGTLARLLQPFELVFL